MNKAVSLALLAVLAPAASAQKDRIVWTDGTMVENVRVVDFNLREIKYSQRGRTEARSSDTVASLDVTKVKDAYRRAYGAAGTEERYSQFITIAQKLVGKDDFMAQWGYLEAARLARANQQQGDAFAVLEELAEKLPDSAFSPELYRFKMEFYLPHGKEKARSALAVAANYSKVAIEKGWPDGFVHEAAYYDLMARAADGTVAGGALQGEFKGLLNKTEGAYPAVADKVKVQMAHAQRLDNKLADAQKTYRSLVDKNGVDNDTRLQALLGLGHTHFAGGDPTNTEPYREALLAFLRVYLEAPSSAGSLRAEALYHGGLASEKWRGPDSGAMARRLRGYLRRDYPDSEWANR